MKIVGRLALVAVALAAAAFVLTRVFDEFDGREIWAVFGRLTSTDIVRIALAMVALLVAEAFLAAAFVPGLSVARGGLTFLTTSAITSVIPGPADYPVRYKMLRSWGYDRSFAATASAGPTVFNSAHKLVMPLVAAVCLVVSDVPIGGVARLVFVSCVVLTVAVVAVAFVAGTEARTAAAAAVVARLARRPWAAAIVRHRNQAAALVLLTWKRAVLGEVLVVASSVVVFVWCMRGAGVGSASASWVALLCVWAVVRAVSALPTTPGDVGVTDVAYVSMVSHITGPGHVNAITAAVVLYRVVTYLAPVVLGVLAFAAWRWTLQRHPERQVDVVDAPAARLGNVADREASRQG
ncbi:MAG TPA: lysylphosphatidylglycerol synthase domain-containing protein [Ilumatobacter sp.]|nr:lysylphosphatidylglycerol synthase domain-containing protein [Ilumatobacter sp.]